MAKAYEYQSPTKLEMPSGNYFLVPASVILDTGSNDKRVTVFSLLSVKRGLDWSVNFSINSMVGWAGKKQNRNPNGINASFNTAIERLIEEGYLSVYGKLGNATNVDAVFNMSKITEQCQQKRERFAIIYIDELQKILGYKVKSSKDSFFSNDVVLLVFSYLRMMIYRRRNELLPGETNIDGKNDKEYDINARRIRSPEAYSGYYCDIAEELGLSPRAVSDAVSALNELELIYSESLPRVKHEGKWKTTYTIFCNRYKRENNYLLADGSKYYMSEIDNKKKQLNVASKND